MNTELFGPARFLSRLEAPEQLLNDALASGKAGYVARALAVIARAPGMGELGTAGYPSCSGQDR
ncbi:MAG TPA: hypothetical protein VMB34_10750 [Acetobacteraceae bacterium]|nr:hypothetical protein [Acetobacteraceae bacterium]